MSKGKTRDMTVGAPTPILLSFMLPMLLGMLFQQFYSMVDTVVVGNFLGNEALAGVGSTGSINGLVLGLCNGMCAGFAIPVAQKFGEKDFEGLRNFVGNMIWLAGGLGLAVTLITTLAARDILLAMNTPADTFQYAYDYVFLVFLGIPAMMLYNLLSGILRSLGDSRTPVLFLVFSSFLNVGLDVLFVLALHWGVAGTAWATLLSEVVSGALCLVYIAKRVPVLHLTRENLKFRGYFARRLLVMGLPMGLQYSVMSIGSILLQTAVNGLGSVAMAAVTAGNKVISLTACPYEAMGATAATYAGQNLGAGKMDRVRSGVRACALMGVAYALLALGVCSLWGRDMTSLFLDSRDADSASLILPLARQLLVINAAAYSLLTLVNLLRFTIQGLGFSNLAVVAGALEMVARGSVALGLVPALGFTGVCFASPAAWVLADLFLVPAYFYCVKKRKAQFHQKEIAHAREG